MARGKKTGGRQAGTLNKATADVKIAAGVHSVAAVERLAYWMRSENATASVAACHALLDRAHGKPPQAVTDGDGGPLIPAIVQHVHQVATEPLALLTATTAKH